MTFSEQHSTKIQGVLHGFDRLIFRGYLNSFFSEKGMYYYMSQKNIKLTGYNKYMKTEQELFKTHINQIAKK